MLFQLFRCLAVLALLLPATASAAEREKVVIGELNWSGAIAIQQVLAEVIRDRLGGQVSFLSGDPAVLLAGLDKGDGSVDVYPDLWMPNQDGPWKRFIAPGGRESIVVNRHPYSGQQGLYVPGFIQDRYGVRSVTDLKRPEVARLFTPESGGKPELLIGPAGWASTNIGLVKARSYGYDALYEPVFTETPLTYAKLAAAIRREKGLLFFAYTPDGIFARYDLRRLEEPPFDGYAMDSHKGEPLYKADGCWRFVGPAEDPDWLRKSRISCAYPDSRIYVAYAKTLRQRAPKIAALLDNAAFDPAAISQWLAEIEVEKRDPQAVARDWVSRHPQIIDAWLNGIPQTREPVTAAPFGRGG